MDTAHAFLLQGVIDDLMNVETSLVSPLMKLRVLAKRIKNETLLAYVTREVEGYGGLDGQEVPDYRKTPATIYLDITSMGGAARTIPAPSALLEEPEYAGHFDYLVFREAIGTVEQMIKDRGQGETAEQFVHHPLPLQLLPAFQQGLRKINPGVPLRVTGARLYASAYKMIEIISIVRSRLLNFTMELAEQFGTEIEFSSFNNENEHNNRIIYKIMNMTHITASGDGNVINTGDHASVTATITITKGDWDTLRKTLADHGIEDGDIHELKSIVEVEKPEGDKLGGKSVGWIMNVAGKALQGVGKIATSVSSTLLAGWIKSFYGL